MPLDTFRLSTCILLNEALEGDTSSRVEYMQGIGAQHLHSSCKTLKHKNLMSLDDKDWSTHNQISIKKVNKKLYLVTELYCSFRKQLKTKCPLALD